MSSLGRALRAVTGAVHRPQRYTSAARWYDLLAAEPVYRVGRQDAVDRLDLRPGDQVVDIGCGTGLNHALLQCAVGPSGRIVGIDASPQMLAQARRRAKRHGWDNVVLIEDDATDLDTSRVAHHLRGGAAEAVISTYALSLMPDWEEAWRAAVELTAPGGRMAVVDMRLPRGRAAWAAPLARLACALGGSDPSAEPWRALERDAVDVAATSRRGGHIQVRVGTRPSVLRRR